MKASACGKGLTQELSWFSLFFNYLDSVFFTFGSHKELKTMSKLFSLLSLFQPFITSQTASPVIPMILNFAKVKFSRPHFPLCFHKPREKKHIMDKTQRQQSPPRLNKSKTTSKHLFLLGLKEPLKPVFPLSYISYWSFGKLLRKTLKEQSHGFSQDSCPARNQPCCQRHRYQRPVRCSQTGQAGKLVIFLFFCVFFLKSLRWLGFWVSVLLMFCGWVLFAFRGERKILELLIFFVRFKWD